MKTISLFLALINSIVAGLLLALTLSTSGIRANEIPWMTAKIVAGTSVILIGLLTWVACARPIAPGILPIAGYVSSSSAPPPSCGPSNADSSLTIWNTPWFSSAVVSSFKAWHPCSVLPMTREAWRQHNNWVQCEDEHQSILPPLPHSDLLLRAESIGTNRLPLPYSCEHAPGNSRNLNRHRSTHIY